MGFPAGRHRVYLDHAATTPMDEAVLAAMAPYNSDMFANPASLHHPGVHARLAMQKATQCFAAALNTLPQSLIWTSGGTESNNLVIQGLCARYRREHGRTGHLIVSSVEHSAVLAVAEHLQHTQGWQVSVLPVTSEGVVSPDTLAQAIRPDTALVSIMHGNNEIGTLQPIEALGQICRSKGVYFHTDAVQTLGKLPLDLSCLPVDYVTGSAHKIYGPKGIGLLWVHPEAVTPDPLFFGGSQQGGLRPGTENVAAVIGFCQAFELCCQRMRLETPRLHTLQDRLMSAIEALFPNQVVINGPLSPQSRVPGNVHLSIVTDSSNPLGKRPQTPSNIGESLVLKLDLKGFALASGSACHSGALTPSHVVLALGKSEALARATLRISMGQSTSEDDVDRLISALAEVLAS